MKTFDQVMKDRARAKRIARRKFVHNPYTPYHWVEVKRSWYSRLWNWIKSL